MREASQRLRAPLSEGRPMPANLQISVIVSTYQRPQHLRRCLLSLGRQQGVTGRYEVVVTDDGSQDETAEMVQRHARQAPFPLKFVTHEHRGFQLARCRNSGVQLAEAPYVLFTDGDCIFPPDHLAKHLASARAGFVRAGDCIRLSRQASAQIDDDSILAGDFVHRSDFASAAKLKWTHLKALVYGWMRHSIKPKLVGNNIGVWRSQLEAVNGFDEEFRGWGCEDDDLADRLRRRGVRIASVLGMTYGYHLWHPPHATAPQKWGDGGNVSYLNRPGRLTKCLRGLRRRELAELSASVRGGRRSQQLVREIKSLFQGSGAAEIELTLDDHPAGAPSSDAECKIRVLTDRGEPIHGSTAADRYDATILLDVQRWRSSLLAQLEDVLLGADAKSSRDDSELADRPAA